MTQREKLLFSIHKCFGIAEADIDGADVLISKGLPRRPSWRSWCYVHFSRLPAAMRSQSLPMRVNGLSWSPGERFYETSTLPPSLFFTNQYTSFTAFLQPAWKNSVPIPKKRPKSRGKNLIRAFRCPMDKKTRGFCEIFPLFF